MCSFQAHQKTVYALERYANTIWSAGSDGTHPSLDDNHLFERCCCCFPEVISLTTGLVRVWPLDAGQSGPAQHLREFNIMPNHKCTLLALEHHVISFDTSGAILIWNASVLEPNFTCSVLLHSYSCVILFILHLKLTYFSDVHVRVALLTLLRPMRSTGRFSWIPLSLAFAVQCESATQRRG